MTHPPVVAATCHCNEEVSLRSRALMVVPTPVKEFWDKTVTFGTMYFEKVVRRSSYKLNLFSHGISFDSWVLKDTFNAAKRIRMHEAFEQVKDHGIKAKDYIRSFFIKRELISKNSIDGFEEYAARSIQAMSDPLQTVLGPYFTGISKKIKSLMHNIEEPIIFAPGMTAEQVGRWFNHWNKPSSTYFMCDASRFDAHIGPDAFSAMRKLFWSVFGTPDKIIQHMRKMVHKRGYTARGWEYSVTGTRASGSSQTTDENSLIMMFFIMRIFQESGIEPGEYAMAVAGDDSFVIINSDVNLSVVREQVDVVAAHAGLKIKPKFSRHLWEVDFLSSLFYPTTSGHVLGPKIGRVMSRTGWTHKPVPNGLDHMRAVASGLETGTKFIPILRAMVATVLRITGGNDGSKPRKYRLLASEAHEMSAETLVFVSNRYRLPVASFDDIEEEINQIDRLPAFLNNTELKLIMDRDL
jgi:hypothetical protein